MVDVFISYSRKDIDFVRQLHQALVAQTRDPWVDWEDIAPVAEWWQEIRTGIEAADTFAFIISPDSLSSPVCHLELSHAIRDHKRVVPLIHRTADEKIAFASLAAQSIDDNISTILDGRDILAIARDNWKVLARHNWLFFSDKEHFEKSLSQFIETLDTDLEHVRNHTRLLVRAHEWENSEHNTSLLLRGNELEFAEGWLAQAGSKEPQPTKLHAEFILSSRVAQRKQQRRLLLGISSAAIIAFLLAVFSFIQSQRASANEKLAQQNAATAQSNALYAESRRLAAEANKVAQSEAERDKTLSVLLAIRSLQTAYTLEADLALQNAMLLPHPYRTILTNQGFISATQISPDGQYLLIEGNGPTRLYDIATGKEVRRFEGQPPANAISSDGRHVFTWTGNAVHLWDILTGGELQHFEASPGKIMGFLASSPDHRLIAIGYKDGTVEVRQTSGDTVLQQLGHMENPVDILTTMAFSPDGRYLALSGQTGTQLRDPATGSILRTFRTNGVINALVFSPDGTRLAAAGGVPNRGTIWLFNVAEGRGNELLGHLYPVTSVAFSADGRRLLTGAGDDSALVLWDVYSFTRIADYSSATGYLRSVLFLPGDQTFITASGEGTINLWSLYARAETFRLSAPGAVFSAHTAFSPDGTRVVSAFTGLPGGTYLWERGKGEKWTDYLQGESIAYSPDGRYLLLDSSLYDAANKNLLLKFTGHDKAKVRSAVFTSDGQYALTGDDAGLVILWNVHSGSQLRQFSGHSAPITRVAISSDSRYVLTGSEDATAKLWDVSSGALRYQISGHSAPITSVAFSPNGEYFLYGTKIGEAGLIEVKNGQEIHSFPKNTPAAAITAFSPDGRYILTTSFAKVEVGLTFFRTAGEGIVHVWDMNTFTEVRQFMGHFSNIVDALFTPNGKYIFTITGDGIGRFWAMDQQVTIQTACASISRDFTSDERSRYRINDYEPTCSHNDQLPELLSPFPAQTLRPVGSPLPTLPPQTQITPVASSGSVPSPTQFPTLAPTLTLAPVTLTLKPISTPTMQTWTPIAPPTSTLVPLKRVAHIGDNFGAIGIGGSEKWRYSGKVGEILRIDIRAQTPANGMTNSERLMNQAFDPELVVWNTDNSVLIQNDDIDPGRETDSRITDLKLPADGAYWIEVRSSENASGGAYTLSIHSNAAGEAMPR